jgi:hypothetical protein
VKRGSSLLIVQLAKINHLFMRLPCLALKACFGVSKSVSRNFGSSERAFVLFKGKSPKACDNARLF